jgi:mannose-6-phosphate isomerase-like protein (cupin superfamily)
MINRYYKDGEKLDVAGLNEITVLIDRSETELTEIGWNCWRPNLDGPPHKHNDKDQVFYITNGKGVVKLGDESFPVAEGNLAYVPAGIVHQTITAGSEPLCYILFNIFNDPAKEGHATFKDHIEKVKQIRKQQAETGRAEMDKELPPEEIRPAKFFNSPDEGKVYDFGSNSTTLLLERNHTNRVELALIRWPEGNRGAMAAHKDKEQTFFILGGKGTVTINGEIQEVVPGNVVFVPRNATHTSEAVTGELVYLCLNSLVNPADESFDTMYKRVAPGRIERWKRGDDSVGE